MSKLKLQGEMFFSFGTRNRQRKNEQKAIQTALSTESQEWKMISRRANLVRQSGTEVSQCTTNTNTRHFKIPSAEDQTLKVTATNVTSDKCVQRWSYSIPNLYDHLVNILSWSFMSQPNTSLAAQINTHKHLSTNTSEVKCWHLCEYIETKLLKDPLSLVTGCFSGNLFSLNQFIDES